MEIDIVHSWLDWDRVFYKSEDFGLEKDVIEQKFTRLVVSLGKGREFWCLVLNTVAKLQMNMV